MVEVFGTRHELLLYGDGQRAAFRMTFTSDGQRIDAQVLAPTGVTPASWSLGGPLVRSGRKQCDWKARLEDAQGNWLELLRPDGACR